MSQETKRRQKISQFFSSAKRWAGSFEKVLWLILIFIQMNPRNCSRWRVFCFPECSAAEPAGPAVWERRMKQVKPGRRPAANHADMKWLKWMLISSHWPVHSLAIYNRKKKKKKALWSSSNTNTVVYVQCNSAQYVQPWSGIISEISCIFHNSYY